MPTHSLKQGLFYLTTLLIEFLSKITLASNLRFSSAPDFTKVCYERRPKGRMGLISFKRNHMNSLAVKSHVLLHSVRYRPRFGSQYRTDNKQQLYRSSNVGHDMGHSSVVIRNYIWVNLPPL